MGTPKGRFPACATRIHNLQQDTDLWYRIKVLIHDLSSTIKDPSSDKRITSTTHELHISAPYFTDTEAIRILWAVAKNEAGDIDSEEELGPLSVSGIEMTIQDAIHRRLANFIRKRRRLCGPHDMVPIYRSVFGIRKGELTDENFLSRLGRSGLGDFRA